MLYNRIAIKGGNRIKSVDLSEMNKFMLFSTINVILRIVLITGIYLKGLSNLNVQSCHFFEFIP